MDPPVRITKRAPRVLVVGDIMTDVLVKPEGPIVRGSDCRAAIQIMYGGSGANQAVWLGHFGVPVTFTGKVGRGYLGRYEEYVRSYGVTPALSGDDDASSGTLISIIDPDGQRSFLTSRGANDTLDAVDLPEALLDGAHLLQVSGHSLVSARPREAVLNFVARARRRGVQISVDPASVSYLEEMGPANFLEWTQGADFCFPNEAEAAVLAGASDPDSHARKLSNVYARTVIKRGVQGAEFIRQEQRLFEPAPRMKAQAVDTTGAGDAFLAGFLATFLSTESPSDSLKSGVAAGSKATTSFGARPGKNEHPLPRGCERLTDPEPNSESAANGRKKITAIPAPEIALPFERTTSPQVSGCLTPAAG